MKNLLPLTLLLAGTSLGAQSFEWNQTPAPPPTHPKEVQVVPPAANPQSAQSGRAGVYPPTAEGQPTAYGETYASDEMTGSHPELPHGTLLKVTNTENGRSVTVRVTDRGQECTDCLVTLSEAAARFLGIEATAPVSLEQEGFSNWNPAAPAPTEANPGTYGNRPGIVAPPAAAASEPIPERVSPPVVLDRDQPATFNRYPATVRQNTEPTVAPPGPTVGQHQSSRGVPATAASPAPVAAETAAAPAGNFSVQLAAYNNETYAVRRVAELKELGLDKVYYLSTTKGDGQTINRVYAGNYANVTAAQAAAKRIAERHQINGIVARM